MATAKDIQKELKRFVNESVGLAAQEVTLALREATPKETGFASTNWIPTLGAFHKGTVGSKAKVTNQAQRTAIAKVRAQAAAGKVRRLHITNNVSYILVLDQGGPYTPPRNFIQPAIKRGLKRTEKKMTEREKRRKIK